MLNELTAEDWVRLWDCLEFCAREDGEPHPKEFLDKLQVPEKHVLRYCYWSEEEQKAWKADRLAKMAQASADKEYLIRREFESELTRGGYEVWKGLDEKGQLIILRNLSIRREWVKINNK